MSCRLLPALALLVALGGGCKGGAAVRTGDVYEDPVSGTRHPIEQSGDCVRLYQASLRADSAAQWTARRQWTQRFNAEGFKDCVLWVDRTGIGQDVVYIEPTHVFAKRRWVLVN